MVNHKDEVNKADKTNSRDIIRLIVVDKKLDKIVLQAKSVLSVFVALCVCVCVC